MAFFDELITSGGSSSAGGVSYGADSSVTVANTGTLIKAENSNRKFLQVYNSGPEAVYIHFGSNQTTESAQPIGVGGVVPLYTSQAIYGYAVANSTIRIVEAT